MGKFKDLLVELLGGATRETSPQSKHHQLALEHQRIMTNLHAEFAACGYSSKYWELWGLAKSKYIELTGEYSRIPGYDKAILGCSLTIISEMESEGSERKSNYLGN